MWFDGYSFTPERLEKFHAYAAAQTQINMRLKEISKEIAELPQIPRSIEQWVESYPDLTKRSFGIDTYKKHMKINKEYNELIDKAEHNLRELKVLFIEDLIAKINGTLNNGSG